jgi:hypothetical protein
MRWITARDISEWGASERENVPSLLNDLIRATVPEVVSIRFPSGSAGQIRGYDGHLRTTAPHDVVPGGDSFWEIGTEGKYLGKVKKDYDEKTKNTDQKLARNATLIVVTTRVWDQKTGANSLEQTTHDLKSPGEWADVRILDAVQIEQWLGRCPSVAARWAPKIGQLPETGVRGLEDFAREFRESFDVDVPFSDAVLLAGREKERDRLHEFLNGSSNLLQLAADSPAEALAFAIAAINAIPDAELRAKFIARAMVVTGADAAAKLQEFDFLCLALSANVADRLGNGKRVIAAVSPATARRTSTSGESLVQLPLPNRYEFADALAAVKPEQERGTWRDEWGIRLAIECGRSITVLSRLKRRVGKGDAPWVSAADAIFQRAVLAGAWDHKNENDLGVIAALAAASHVDVASSLNRLRDHDEPPVERIGSIWAVRAPMDALLQLGAKLTADDFERFRQACTRVFTDIDPALHEPPDDEPFPRTPANSPRFSEELRVGLASTFLLLHVLRDKAVFVLDAIELQRLLDGILSDLPGLRDNHYVILSLKEGLPYLIEAAPRPFLEALEHLLEGGQLSGPVLFRDQTGGVFGSYSPHPRILWALEQLAWDPEHLPRAADLLARLMEIDPGGALSNRPLNSLRKLFLAWHPETNANLDARTAVLNRLIAKRPDLGWRLCLELLPRAHDIAHPSPKPRFAEAGSGQREVLTWGIVRRATKHVVETTIRLAADRAERWVEIVDRLDEFPPELREAAIADLERFACTVIDAGDRTALWDATRRKLGRHRQFADAEWAMPNATLSRLDTVEKTLRPADPVQANAWLFEEMFPDLPVPNDERMDRRGEFREAALHEIYAAKGTAGILELAAMAKQPGSIVDSIDRVIGNQDDLFALTLDALRGDGGRAFFGAVLSTRLRRQFVEVWATKFLSTAASERWPPQKIANAVHLWPDTRETFDLVAECGEAVDDAYWRTRPGWLQGESKDLAHEAIGKFLKVGRVDAAILLVHDQAAVLPTPLVLEVLDALVERYADGKAQAHQLMDHYVGETLKTLANRADIDRTMLARQEIRFFPLLRYRDYRFVIHDLVLEQPSLFVDLIEAVFKPENGPPQEPSEEARRRADIAFRVLESLKSIPGTVGNDIDAAKLRTWVDDARRLARERDRVTMTEQYIGHLLAYSPPDPTDGVWPHLAVRALIDELESDQLETGIEVQSHNKVGVTSRGVFDGGEQERARANEARAHASQLAKWPRTAAMMRRIAASWERRATDWDEEAQNEKRKG